MNTTGVRPEALARSTCCCFVLDDGRDAILLRLRGLHETISAICATVRNRQSGQPVYRGSQPVGGHTSEDRPVWVAILPWAEVDDGGEQIG